MSTLNHDAWDECQACGHDRDDHYAEGCLVPMGRDGVIRNCDCSGFEQAPA